MLLKLAFKSLLHRKASVILTTIALSMSLFVMFGVGHIKEKAKASFASSVSGVDLIVGARTGDMNLLLYSVFRIGKATSNMSWNSYNKLAQEPMVKWSFPIALGDSHRGYRVLGTTTDYFTHFSYAQQQPLIFAVGDKFSRIFDVVVGAEVAQKLNYQINDNITLSHGIGSTSFTHHDDMAFRIVGILTPTGTPVDQTLHVSLQGLEAVHLTKQQRNKLLLVSDQQITAHSSLVPQSITAVMVGLTSRMGVFQLQRKINSNTDEALMAILPGVALSELWQMMSVAENTLALVSILVVVSTLFGLSAMLLASLRERQQEIKLLRVIGASPFFIYFLIELEALFIAGLSVLIALAALIASLTLAKDFLLAEYGLSISSNVVSVEIIESISIILLLTVFAAFPPSFKAFYEANRK